MVHVRNIREKMRNGSEKSEIFEGGVGCWIQNRKTNLGRVSCSCLSWSACAPQACCITYRMIGEDMESASIQQNTWNDVYYGMADDLCEGNYFLYNEYSQETDKADIIF